MEIIVWAIVALVLGGAVIWRADRYARAQLQFYRVSTEVDELSRREREVAVKLAEDTAEETAELKRAELRLKTAHANVGTELAEQLKATRFEAEQRVVQADADARANLAEELARSERSSTGENEGDVISRYYRYVTAAKQRDASTASIMDFEEFLGVMRDYDEL